MSREKSFVQALISIFKLLSFALLQYSSKPVSDLPGMIGMEMCVIKYLNDIMSIKFLLLLRLKQAWRAVISAGIGWVLLMLFVVMGVLLQFFSNLLLLPAKYSIILAAIGILSVHINRKDLMFLKSVTSNILQFRLILFTEYTLILFPVILFQLLQLNFWVSAWLFILPLLLAFLADFLKAPKTAAIKTSIPFLPLQAFELKVFIEKRKIAMAFCYGISYLSFIHISFFLISIFCCAVACLDAFKSTESREMIHWNKHFLRFKLILNIKLVSALFIIPIIIALGFNWDLKWLILYAFLYLITMICLVITYKYAHFTLIYDTAGSSNILMILALLAILPGGILIAVAFGFYNYFIAKRKLQYYYA